MALKSKTARTGAKQQRAAGTRPGASAAQNASRAKTGPGASPVVGTAIPKASSWQPKDPQPTFAASPAAAPTPAKPLDATDKTVSTVLGEVTWLMSQSPQHKQLAIADLEWQENPKVLMPALLLRQFKLFYDTERNIPVGCVLFAKVSDAVAARLDAGGRLATLDDWRSGDTVRVMATVAPFGGEVRL
jgi:cytolysin-activating lysine-acyltransferase